ncbi:hypothetical protein ABK040_000713 [Willaertia magna]
MFQQQQLHLTFIFKLLSNLNNYNQDNIFTDIDNRTISHTINDNSYTIDDFTYHYFLFDFFSIKELLNSFCSLNLKVSTILFENENFWERKFFQYFNLNYHYNNNYNNNFNLNNLNNNLNNLRLELLNFNNESFWNDLKSLQFEQFCNGKTLQNISEIMVDYKWKKDKLKIESKNQWTIIKCLYLLENINYFSKLKFFKKIKISKNYLILRFFIILFKTNKYQQNLKYFCNNNLCNNLDITNCFVDILTFDNKNNYTNDYNNNTNKINNKEEIITILKLQNPYLFTINFLNQIKQKLKLFNEMLIQSFTITNFPIYFLNFISDYSVNFKTTCYNKNTEYWDRTLSRNLLFKKENLFLLSSVDFSFERGYHGQYIQICPCVSIIEKNNTIVYNNNNNFNSNNFNSNKDYNNYDKLIIKLYEKYSSNIEKCYDYIYPNDILKIINHLDNFFTIINNNNYGNPLFTKNAQKNFTKNLVGIPNYILSFSNKEFYDNYRRLFHLNCNDFNKCVDNIYNYLTKRVNEGIDKCVGKVMKNLFCKENNLLNIDYNNDYNMDNKEKVIDWRGFCNEINLNYPTRKEMEIFSKDCDLFFVNLLQNCEGVEKFKKIKNQIWKNYLFDLEKLKNLNIDDEYRNDYHYLKITIRKCVTKYLNYYIYSQPNLVYLIPHNGKLSRCLNKECSGIIQCFRLILLPIISKFVNCLMTIEFCNHLNISNNNNSIIELNNIKKEINEKMKQMNFDIIDYRDI